MSTYRKVGWEARGESFGASELGALLGVSPYETREQLIDRKARKTKTASTFAMRAGSYLESGILTMYAKETGRECEEWQETIASDALPHLVVTPDARESGTLTLVEIKHSAGGKGWGVGDVIDRLEAYTVHEATAAPLHYQVQVQGQLAVTGYEHCRIVGFIRGNLRVYEVPRHEGVIRRIREECARGWDEVLRLREGLALEVM